MDPRGNVILLIVTSDWYRFPWCKSMKHKIGLQNIRIWFERQKTDRQR